MRAVRGREESRECEDEYSLDEGIESLGFGWFQIALLVLCGATQLADATELLVLSLLNNPVQCAFGVSKAETAWLASAVFAGMLCGAYITGHVSDRYGRRVGFGMTTTLVASFGLISAGAPNFALLVGSRFFVGMGVGGANAALSLYAEYLPTAMRGRGLILFFFFFSVGGVLEAGVAYWLMPDWRALLFATAIPSVFLVICFPIVPESPRFLVVHGKIEDAERCLFKAASCNGSKLPAGRLTRVRPEPRRYAAQAIAEILTDDESNGEASVFTEVRRLLKQGLLRQITVRLWVLFFMMAVMYYALVQLTVSLSIPPAPKGHECDRVPSEAYWHVVVMNSGELPGLIAACLLLDIIGRKGTLALLSSLTAGFSLLLIFDDSAADAAEAGAGGGTGHLVVVMFAARACALGFNQSLWIFTAEAYPTAQRALGIGAASALARVGGIISPFVALDLPKATAVGVCVACGLACAAAAVSMPIETRGQSLMDSHISSQEAYNNAQERGVGERAEGERLLGNEEQDAHRDGYYQATESSVP